MIILGKWYPAFVPGKTKSLYNLHFNTFKDVIGIDITKYIYESDKGSVIEAVCTDNNIVHIYCFRHYLTSLKYNKFSYSIGLLLKSFSEVDYNQSKSELIAFWKSIKKKNKLTKLNRVLKKVGLHLNKK